MIRLSITDRFGSDPTEVDIFGEDEESICNIIVAKLQVADYEVEIEDASGEMIPFEEYDHG